MTTLTFRTFTTARKAIAHADATGMEAITVNGSWAVARKEDALRMQRGRVEFAYIGIQNGMVMTVPV
jgi:hypothetical protein